MANRPGLGDDSIRKSRLSAGKTGGQYPHLMAFNELQHQLFNYLRHLPTENDWTIETLLEGLGQKAKASGVEGDFGWAVKWSVERITA